MFEVQVARIQQKMEDVLRHPDWELTPCRAATTAQVEEFEHRYGLPLPQDYKEFILSISDYFSLHSREHVHDFVGVLGFYDEQETDHFTCLVPVPFRWQRFEDIDTSFVVYWDDLSAHEQSGSRLALWVHEPPDNIFSLLLLSGPHAGNMWSCREDKEGEEPIINSKTGQISNFIDWFEDELDELRQRHQI